MSNPTNYVGRFAPSPSGPLHFGSLVAALASFLDAKANNGKWLLRIEDLDPPRESATAPTQIFEQLTMLGLHWDGEVLFQSHRLGAYQKALDELEKYDLTFPCICSRKDVQGIYLGTCRHRTDTSISHAIRIKATHSPIEFFDQIQGHQIFKLCEEVGDFIIRRKDGLFAYQLAVVVDDAFQDVTHVVRGMDLLDSTPKQIHLNQSLNLNSPRYAHLPVILGDDGSKLSKQNHAEPVSITDPSASIKMALAALNQPLCPSNQLQDILQFAIEHWSLTNISAATGIHFSSLQ